MDFPTITPTAFLTNGKQANLSIVVEKRGGTILPSVINNSTKALRIDRIKLLEIDLTSSTIDVYRQGFSMPSDPSGFYHLECDKGIPYHGYWKPTCFTDSQFFAHSLLALKKTDSNNISLYGANTCRRFENIWTIEQKNKSFFLCCWFMLEGRIEIKPGEELELEHISITENDDLNTLLDDYAEATAELNNAVWLEETVKGWNDWNYYRKDKDEKIIRKNADAIEKMRKAGYPLEYIVMDDGWCDHSSEWLKPCKKFPSGIKKLTSDLKRKGIKLGIWYAPYIANEKTDVVKKHKNWLVKDAKTGKPKRLGSSNVGASYVIDLTVPAALEWVRETTRKMIMEWKVKYIKLDGPCQAHFRDGKFSKDNITAVEVARMALKTIWEECKGKAIIEGEGLYLASVGYVHTQRIQQDNMGFWKCADSGGLSMGENTRQELLGNFMQNRLWSNMRENVILRDFPCPNIPKVVGNPEVPETPLRTNEIIFQLTAATIAGGSMLLTDPVDQLMRNPRTMDTIAKFLPHHETTRCHMIDAFNGERQPNFHHVPIETKFEKWDIVGIFNWDDSYRDFTLPLKKITNKKSHVFDFWNQEYLGTAKSRWEVKDVPAHGCKIFALRTALPHPQLVGTDMHILQGAVDLADCKWRDNMLEIDVKHFRQKEARLSIHKPKDYKLENVLSNAKDFIVDDRSKDILTIQFNGRKRTKFKLSWNSKAK